MGSCFPYGYVYFWDCRRQYLINDKRDMTYVQYILILIIWYLTCRFECYWYMGFFNQLCNYQLTAAGVHKLHGESHIHRKSHFRYMCFIIDLVISAISSMYGRTANWEMFERQGNEQGIRDAECRTVPETCCVGSKCVPQHSWRNLGSIPDTWQDYVFALWW